MNNIAKQPFRADDAPPCGLLFDLLNGHLKKIISQEEYNNMCAYGQDTQDEVYIDDTKGMF